jgi:hypothetical protein
LWECAGYSLEADETSLVQLHCRDGLRPISRADNSPRSAFVPKESARGPSRDQLCEYIRGPIDSCSEIVKVVRKISLEVRNRLPATPTAPWLALPARCMWSAQWMGLPRPGAESAFGHGAVTTALLYIFEQPCLDGQRLWSLSTPVSWRDLSWSVFLPFSFVANVVVAIFAWSLWGQSCQANGTCSGRSSAAQVKPARRCGPSSACSRSRVSQRWRSDALEFDRRRRRQFAPALGQRCPAPLSIVNISMFRP